MVCSPFSFEQMKTRRSVRANNGQRSCLIGASYCSAPNIMDDLPYLGPMPGNVDILAHFTKRIGAPNTVQNMDPGKFSIFDTYNVVNMLVEDNGLAPCYLFRLGFLSNSVCKILPLALIAMC
ncbi:hypothetical protein E2542_SST20578 [Spatholobus suberectus]|nr:hypothetical protein E2542_SST20578 [Spatholobus suberectus]